MCSLVSLVLQRAYYLISDHKIRVMQSYVPYVLSIRDQSCLSALVHCTRYVRMYSDRLASGRLRSLSRPSSHILSVATVLFYFPQTICGMVDLVFDVFCFVADGWAIFI